MSPLRQSFSTRSELRTQMDYADTGLALFL